MNHEISDLQNEVRRLNQHNNSLQAKVTTLESDILSLMKTKSFTPKEIKKYFHHRKYIDVLEDKLQQSQHEINQMKLKASQNTQSSSSILSNFSNLEMEESSATVHSIIEVNNDMSQKINDIKKQLNQSLFENAELKRNISTVEAENAKLSSENYQLNWKLESSKENNKSSNNSSVEELQQQLTVKKAQLDNANYKIQSMKEELKQAKKEASKIHSMMNENSLIKQEMLNYSQKYAKHKEELRKAKLEIERLTLKNNESDEQIILMEKSLQRRQRENNHLVSKNRAMMEEFERNDFHNSQNSNQHSNNFSHHYSSNSSHDSHVSSHLSSPKLTRDISFGESFDTEIHKREKQLLKDFNDLKAFCTSLRDENASLKAENIHLKEQIKEMNAFHQQNGQRYHQQPPQNNQQWVNPIVTKNGSVWYDRVNQNYQLSSSNPQKNGTTFNLYYTKNINTPEKKPPTIALPEAVKFVITRYTNNFILKMSFFETKLISGLDHLNLNLQRFSTTFKQACLFQQELYKFRAMCNDDSSEQFLMNLNREIRIIDTLSKSYAKKNNIPVQYVPKPSQLLSDPQVLKEFVHQKYRKHHKHQKYCY
ncbi:hypothetical protein TRFO_34046 [Tritrichomonas foetus]|uniref:Uncharacterized protein n=1 Tax=Tritrichomonas foetus TaxID=1144522 RepID=A0A1J4JLF1_9EUKA|nr:hypothetical protein TRFO_34046 [Tritrichomonas foetus]|eukprot:OHS99505.1 hypothetical protein TRFO_34046 [Tritrichomonas foetus]